MEAGGTAVSLAGVEAAPLTAGTSLPASAAGPTLVVSGALVQTVGASNLVAAAAIAHNAPPSSTPPQANPPSTAQTTPPSTAAAGRVGGLDDLARLRGELGLAQGEGTLARLDVGGRSFYGINAHGQPVNLQVNAITRTHAEADAFQQAANAGMSGGRGTLSISTAPCAPRAATTEACAA